VGVGLRQNASESGLHLSLAVESRDNHRY
jgi:hypothetical protein